MKHLMMIFMIILCLTSFNTFAEDSPDMLFPVVDGNGKWGYINREGTFIIPRSLTALRTSGAITR